MFSASDKFLGSFLKPVSGRTEEVRDAIKAVIPKTKNGKPLNVSSKEIIPGAMIDPNLAIIELNIKTKKF